GRDAGLGDPTPLGPDLLALGLCQAGEEVVERRIAAIAPAELHPVALHEAAALEQRRLPGRREEHMERGQPARIGLGDEGGGQRLASGGIAREQPRALRSEEHTSELQSRENLVCRLLLEKKKQ